MKLPLFGTLIAASCLLAALAPSIVLAQQAGTPPSNPPATPGPAAPPSVTLDVRDAPLREVILQLCQKANIQYALDPAVQGFVTLKVNDQPFDNVLKLVLLASSAPLTYTVTNGVYEIKPRPQMTTPPSAPSLPALSSNGDPVITGDTGHHLAVIPLTYLDPYDLQQLLGVTLVPSGTRGGASGGGQSSGGPTIGGGSGIGFPGSGSVGALGGNGAGGRLIGGSGNGSNGNRSGR